MIKKISVIGAGTMGHSIASAFALYGYSVNLFDTYDEQLKKVKGIMKTELLELVEGNLFSESEIEKALDKVTLFNDLEAATKDSDYVIEAIPEKN